MALTYSDQISFGTVAPDFSLPGIDGKTYSLDAFRDAKALVVIFMCNHCPYVQAVWDRLIALQSEFPEAKFVGINANDATDYPDDNFEKMKEHAEARRMNFPYLRDETQEVARAYGALCTPDIFVYDTKKQLRYHGRVDDNWKELEKVQSRDLANAIKLILEDKDPPHDKMPSMGCSIKWKKRE